MRRIGQRSYLLSMMASDCAPALSSDTRPSRSCSSRADLEMTGFFMEYGVELSLTASIPIKQWHLTTSIHVYHRALGS